MSHKRLIWQELSQLALSIAQADSVGATELRELVEQLGRLVRVQYKANALQETQLDQQRETMDTLQAAIARQEEMIAALQQNHGREVESARHDLLLAMLPVVDGLEAALANARQQLERLSEGEPTRVTLTSWLDGVRLVHQRMLDALSQAGVEPIVAVGQLFDPRLHVATAVDASNRVPLGIVVSEERRGYKTPAGVLRYAEVIVSRPGVLQRSASRESRRAPTPLKSQEPVS
jgi:molecular chaperone GrpE (heat shock protein)